MNREQEMINAASLTDHHHFSLLRIPRLSVLPVLRMSIVLSLPSVSLSPSSLRNFVPPLSLISPPLSSPCAVIPYRVSRSLCLPCVVNKEMRFLFCSCTHSSLLIHTRAHTRACIPHLNPLLQETQSHSRLSLTLSLSLQMSES